MSVLADYSETEQKLLRGSLSAAAVAVAASSIGKAAETASEGFAAASYILGSREQYLDNMLVGSVIFDLEERAKNEQPFPDFEQQVNTPGSREVALDTLRKVSDLLARKTDAGEAEGYKDWLMTISGVTAAGGKEGGGWFGWGAVQVNDAEKAALVQVADTLGLSLPE
jgi:hypothetical protein